MKSDKKIAIMATAILVVSVFAVFAVPVSAQLLLPDLVVEKSVTIDDGNLTVSYTVTNIGEDPAGESTTCKFVDGVLQESEPCPALGPDEGYSGAFDPELCPCGAILNVTVCADCENVVDESDETNNCEENVIPCPGKPDLIIEKKEASWADGTLTITYTVANCGPCACAAAGPSTTGIYVNGVQVAADPVPGLAKCTNHTSTVVIPDVACPCGETIRVKVLADKHDLIDECDEDNNWSEENVITCPAIEVNKTVWNPKTGKWVKELNASINDTLRFKCTIHNDGDFNLSKIRFWDILDCSLNYSDKATLNGADIVLSGNYVFKPKVLHPDNLLWNLSSPWNESFTELCPDVDHHRKIMDWEDTNNDNRVSACDQIYLLGIGVPASYHVDNVPYTLNVTNTETGESMYIDSELDYEEVDLSAPVCTQWNEVCCCKDSYHLQNWTDVDSGKLNEGDFIVLRNKRTGEVANYSVKEVTIDLVVSKEWEIDMPSILEPCKTITIEFNAQVVKCGVDDNTQFAKGWYSYPETGGEWVYDNDTVTINVPCPTGEATDPTGRTKDVYYDGEIVYATGSGFVPNSTLRIYITEDKHWEDGMAINSTVFRNVSDVQVDGDGNITGFEMWPNPRPGEYDMVFDQDQDGFYNAGRDAVDHWAHAGFSVLGRVPALTPVGIAVLVGLLAIIATSVIVRKRKKR